jgi:hypothetical protein
MRRTAVFKRWKRFRGGETNVKVKTACSTIVVKLAANVCSTFSRSGWSVVRSASFAKGGTWIKETVTVPPRFQLGVIR